MHNMQFVKLKKLIDQFCFFSVTFLCYLLATDLCKAQIKSDHTLSTEVNTLDNINFNISGGKQAGNNLFHSFSQFSVPTRGSAIFDNAPDIQNIFNRVTGGSISDIDGLIKAHGNTNLFLLNPNGIIFGANAELNIGGSFIATTAEQIDFADETFFSATNLQSTPLLTVSIPIGLQFGETAKSIVNQSTVKDSNDIPVGLQIQPNKTLALVGGDIFLDGSGLFAPSGRIEVGSVASNSFVGLIPITEGWILEYKDVPNFQDIKLFQEAFIDTNGVSPGNIVLQGRIITISDQSSVVTINLGKDPGGTIVMNASESLEITDRSMINSNTFSTGASSDIIIETKKLIVRDGSFIDISNQPFIETSNHTSGEGGRITVNASESVEIDGSGGISRLTTDNLGSQNAGKLTVTTQRLILRDGGQINSSTGNFGGNGGSVIVNASEYVEVSGQGITEGEDIVSSGLFATTGGETTFGDGGDIRINTGRLVFRDGGTISVAAVEGSTGRAGNLEIEANSLSLNQGTITAETAQSGGEAGANITLKISDWLTLENKSLISATANGSADGGNIDIDADFVIAFPNQNNDIIARAAQGIGGDINITTNRIFGIEKRKSRLPNNTNDLDASSDIGLDGEVLINEPDVNLTEGLEELPSDVVDVTRLVAQNLCQQGKGSEFIVTGKGGLAPSPTQVRDGEISEIDLVEPAPFVKAEVAGAGRGEISQQINCAIQHIT